MRSPELSRRLANVYEQRPQEDAFGRRPVTPREIIDHIEIQSEIRRNQDIQNHRRKNHR